MFMVLEINEAQALAAAFAIGLVPAFLSKDLDLRGGTWGANMECSDLITSMKQDACSEALETSTRGWGTLPVGSCRP